MAEPLSIVFDLDGTLIDSAPQIHAVANKVFTDSGLQPFAFDVVRGAIGNGVGVLVSRLLQSQGLESTGPLQAELAGHFVKIYEEAFDLTVLYPGVAVALTELAKAGHRLAICTNKPEGPARAVLRHFGLADLFEVMIGGDTLATRKPDPAPLLAAVRLLGPGAALFVGDSEVDAEIARAAHVPLALYTQGYRTAAVETLGAAITFDDFSALPRLISRLGPLPGRKTG